MTAASQFYVSGPAYLWSSAGPFNFTTPSSNTWNYIGWSQRGFDVQFVPENEDIEVDYAAKMPGDVMIAGQEARISGVLSRYNEPVIMSLASFMGPTGTPGSFGNNQLGSLYHAEGLDYALLMQCPYFAKAVYGASASPMVPGFVFYSVHLSNPVQAVHSIRQKTPSVAWRAVPVFGSVISATFTPGAPYNASEIYSTNVPTAAVGTTTWPNTN